MEPFEIRIFRLSHNSMSYRPEIMQEVKNMVIYDIHFNIYQKSYKINREMLLKTYFLWKLLSILRGC